MGASEPPFIYEKPSSYAFTGGTALGFNPKSVTEATWTSTPPKAKQNGPLINAKELNRHPDSYFIVPYGNLDWKPMSRHTRAIVFWVRIVQLVLRIFAFLGIAGLLVCVICVKPQGDTLDWIIRIPPAIGLFHTTYAIYHLSRSPKGRTPGSSASYMIFAAIIDASLLPFVALTALLAHNQLYGALQDGQQPWATMFGSDDQSRIIITSTWLISVVDGALLLTSLVASIYLALTFRKISKLPPDMNPLEDNLTSRHKRNKSSISTAATESSQRDSATPLMSPSRSVPFSETRNESSPDVSMAQRRPTASNRSSRVDLARSVFEQPRSERSSRADLLNQTHPNSRPASTVGTPQSRSPVHRSPVRPGSTVYSERQTSPSRQSPTRPQSVAYSEYRYSPVRHESPGYSPADNKQQQQQQYSPTRPKSTVYADMYQGSPRPPSTRPPSTIYGREHGSDEENWTSYPSPAPSPSPPRLAPPELQHLRESNAKEAHRASPPAAVNTRLGKYDLANRKPQPLGMNPPTPLNPEHRRFLIEARALRDSNGNTPVGNVNYRIANDSEHSSASAWQDIRLDANETPRSEMSSSPSVVGAEGGGGGKGRKVYGELPHSGQVGQGLGRIVSSGVDAERLGRDGAGMRAREVSGKVVEEGRGRGKVEYLDF